MNSERNQFETPFADVALKYEESNGNGHTQTQDNLQRFILEAESPFSKTYELQHPSAASSPFGNEYAEFVGELSDPEFSGNLYELASELEDSWLHKISNEAAMGEEYLPYVKRQASQYFGPLLRASEGMIDKLSQRFSGVVSAELTEAEMDAIYEATKSEHTGLTPIQEQFLGSVFNKVKNVVKKGIKAVSKILPMNIILNKLKGLVRPLLDRVLKFAIGKLPANLQPYAQTLAKKFLNLETPLTSDTEQSMSLSGEINAIQTELDNEIARLVYTPDETEAEQQVMQYENSTDELDQSAQYASGGIKLPSLVLARHQFVNELAGLEAGESPAPAIERFLPVAIMALKPVIKMGISIIGRPKVINFLAGLLAKLVEKYVPQQVAKPLAASIIDAGMSVIGFETVEMSKPDVGYEALVNTIQETIQNMEALDEEDLNDQETLTMNFLEAFETAAANNFPPQYIREDLRTAKQAGVWVMKPRNGSSPAYKKYTTVFTATIDPAKTKSVTTFRDLPLSQFLRDKLGLDPSKPIQARVHLFESIGNTKLSQISKHENLPGFGPSQPYSWVQLHPLSKQAAGLLINEPALGKDFPKKFTSKRFHITAGQRFYFLEISGARLRIGTGKPAHSDDVKGVVNFVKSSVSLNYYFSEEQSKSIVEKLNQNDFLGVASGIRHSVKGVLQNILTGNVSNKVQIIHETFPEMYLDNYYDPHEGLVGVGKSLLTGLIQNLVSKVSGQAYNELRDFFKSRAGEFKQAQAEPQDGVTIKLIWSNVPGLSVLKAVIAAIRGNQPFNPTQLTFPNFPKPEIQIKAGKQFN